jgi:NADH dehydrogenase/NADH:ubiquinone oxidoreductase subunit G
MLNLDINGRRVTVRKGTTLLTACREAGLEVPTLCHHEALEPYGACRLCVVEVQEPKRSRSRIVTACNYPAKSGLQVETDSEAVLATRREVLDLLLARCPGSPVIRELAAGLGLHRSSYPPDQNRDNCILCGLCVRICEKLGFSAIIQAGRGPHREIVSPLREPPPDCTGCGACARICPTQVIPLVERNGRRRIWERDFELVRCTGCGRAFITREYQEARVTASGLPAEHFELCDECSRDRTARLMYDHMVFGDRPAGSAGAGGAGAAGAKDGPGRGGDKGATP